MQRRSWIWTSSTAPLLSGSPKRRTMSAGLSFQAAVSLLGRIAALSGYHYCPILSHIPRSIMFFLNLDWKCYIGWRGSAFKWEGVWCPFMFTLWFWWQMVGKVRWLRWFNMNGLDQGLLWKHFFSYKVSEIPWLNQLHLLIGCVVIGGAKDSVYTHLEEASHYLHLSNCGIIYIHIAS